MMYKKYQDLLTGKADTETAAFLQELHALSSFSKVNVACVFILNSSKSIINNS